MKAIVPDWAKDAIWYQIFPERFANGDTANDPGPGSLEIPAPEGWSITPWTSDWYARAEWERKLSPDFFRTILHRRYGGDIRGIMDKLDYIRDLGANAIYLNPMFRAASHHKYDGASFHHIDEHFGPDPEGDRRMIEAASETADPETWVWTSADRLFLELVQKVHGMGMRTIIDGVFNHCGRQFFAFQNLLKNKKDSPYLDWYHVLEWTDKTPDGFYYNGWWGINELPEFRRDENTFNTGYKKYLFDITRRWLAPEGKTGNGVDGFRLDVAFCVPHGFWKEWRAHVKSVKPDAYLTAEVIDLDLKYVSGDEFDAMMNYQFTMAAVCFLADRKKRIPSAEFDRRLAKIRAAYPEDVTYVMQNLMASHDTPRLRSILANPDLDIWDFTGFHHRSKTELNKSYGTGRGGKREEALHRLCAALQMTYIGAPMIYYGDELGMPGANDPDCRKPMLWPGMKFEKESMPPGRTGRPTENKPDLELLAWYRKLAALRHRHEALRRGTFETAYSEEDGHLFAFVRRLGGEAVLCVINADDRPRTAIIPGGGIFASSKDVLGAGALSSSGKNAELKMPPLAAAIFPIAQ